MKIFSKNLWFTFVEIILATMISVIILIFTFSFLADSMNSIATSDMKSKILSELYSVESLIDNYKRIYLTWGIVIDNPVWSGSDVLVLKDLDWDYWVIFWIVNRNTMKIESWSLYNNYDYKMLWYKKIFSWQINAITSNPDEVYNLDFTNDHYFNFPIKSFQVDFYNTWAILDFNIDILVNYNSWYSWELRENIPSSAYEIFKLNLDF